MLTDSGYQEFLDKKSQWNNASGFEPNWMPDYLFPFQQYLVNWAIHMGRCAIYADCGLGKSPQELVWAENVKRHTGKPVLLVTPLGVTFQMEAEAQKFGIDASISRDGRGRSGVTITNYERLEKFNPDQFGGLVCDESSAIKSFDGKRRAVVTEFMRILPYRLLGTATAAPNDYIELGTSSEALGYLGHMDMLARFFTNKDRTSKSRGGRWRAVGGEKWRFKGHAEDVFWQWVSSWARAVRKPSDLGFDDNGFVLPELTQRQHLVHPRVPDTETPSVGLHEERRKARITIEERCEKAAALLFNARHGVAWCQLNPEGQLLARLIKGSVEVSGSDSVDAKEEKLAAFSRGEIRVLITKPSIGAWGMNWQHCHRMTYFPSYSYEQYYQAVRRSWRFGQTNPVEIDVITTEGGMGSLAALERKATQADRMFDALTMHMRNAVSIQRGDNYDQKVKVPTWVTC
jgi:hypothetical protein